MFLFTNYQFILNLIENEVLQVRKGGRSEEERSLVCKNYKQDVTGTIAQFLFQCDFPKQ